MIQGYNYQSSTVHHRDMTLESEVAGQSWRSLLLPSLLRLQMDGLATDTSLVVVGQQGACQEPLLAHSLALAAASPALASLLATSRDPVVTLILAGVEREEMEEVLEDIYLGRERARVFLQKWGFWEEDVQDESDLGGFSDMEEAKFRVNDDLRQKQTLKNNTFSSQDIILKEENPEKLDEIKDEFILEQDLPKINKPNKCGYCSKMIKTKCFKNHIEKHRKSKLSRYNMEKRRGIKHMCDECGKCFTHKFILAAHIRDKHSGKTEKCDKCDFTCKGPKHQLAIHKKMRHGLCNYVCPMCDFKSSSDEELERHNKRLHASQEVVISPKMRLEKIRKEREALMDFTCKTCKLAHNSRQSLALHIKADHKGIRYNCTEEDCHFSGKTKTTLNSHKNNIHLGIKHKCKICEYEAGQTSQIRKHMIIKHNTETFSCNICAYRCQDSKRMQKHVLLRHHKLSA